MISLFRRAQERQTGIPADLVASIESADIVFRPTADEDGAPRVLVRAAGLGAFYYDGKTEAADRIARMWALPKTTAHRAAKLLAQVVAHRNREMHTNRPSRGFGSAYVRAAFQDLPEFMR